MLTQIPLHLHTQLERQKNQLAAYHQSKQQQMEEELTVSAYINIINTSSYSLAIIIQCSHRVWTAPASWWRVRIASIHVNPPGITLFPPSLPRFLPHSHIKEVAATSTKRVCNSFSLISFKSLIQFSLLPSPPILISLHSSHGVVHITKGGGFVLSGEQKVLWYVYVYHLINPKLPFEALLFITSLHIL